MRHEMKLNNRYFLSIQSGVKTIEMRLNDEKRQLIHVGDIIEFQNRDTNETILTKVIALHPFSSFQELYSHFPKKVLGYFEEEEANPHDMEQFYSLEEQSTYGVLGIEICLVKES